MSTLAAKFIAPVGIMIEAPSPDEPGLNPPIKAGDRILSLCRVQGGDGWWCGPFTVKYITSGVAAYRPKYAKVDKLASTWILAP